MQFQPVYDDGVVFLPKIELNMTPSKSIGIITDLKRKQLLMNQLADYSQYYLFRAGQNEYMHLKVQELITFLINVTKRSDEVSLLLDYFALKEVRKVKIKNLSSSKRVYVTLLRVFFAHQPTIVIEEPYFFLEEADRRHLRRILDNLSKEKQILILTSNLEDAIISCDTIYRLNDAGFHALDIQDSEEDKHEVQEQDQPNITLQKIYTKKMIK